MLLSVYIENIALIKRLSLEPSGGFCAFTGETGAGKSIIIDSLGLLCGARTDKDIIRTGEDEALVEGIFSVSDQKTLCALSELEVVPEEDGNITVTRKICRDGKSVAKINGRAVPLSKLKGVMSQLISIHGQQDTQAFADLDKQRDMLDSFADNRLLLEEYAAGYKNYKEIKRKLEDLCKDDLEREHKLDMLRYRIDELTKAAIYDGEKEELLAERKRLANSEKIISKCGEAYSALYGREGSAAEAVSEACLAVSALDGIIPEANELYARLESAKYELIDIAESVKDYLESDNDNLDARLDQCESRIELIKRLEGKYKTQAEGFPALLEQWQGELEINENSDAERARLADLLEKAKKDLLLTAKKLRNSRQRAADALCARVTAELCQLDMPNVTFKVDIHPLEDFTPLGMEETEFLISANKGELPKPMAKIASGGELSRIMLCLKCVFAHSEAIGTLIFDEIDAGVSGKTSEKIGIKLKNATDGGNTQVICVTHSAILAAKADAHYKIAKGDDGQRTVTTVERLDAEGRKAELARIMGGLNVTETVLRAAEEMLE